MAFQWDNRHFAMARNPFEWGDRRDQQRAPAIFLYARLFFEGTEQFCRVRDISPRGLRLESPHLPPVGERVRVELHGLKPCFAKVVWRRGDNGGLEFEERQDLNSVLHRRTNEVARPGRAQRYALSLPMTIDCGDALHQCDVVDIAFGGLKLRGLAELDIGTRGVAYLGKMVERFPGQICWQKAGFSGFQFDCAIPREELVTLLTCRS